MRCSGSWLKLPSINQARDQIDQLSQPQKYATFGFSTKSNNIISGVAQQQNLLEKQLVHLQEDQHIFSTLVNDTTSSYRYLVKHLLMFLSEPLQPSHKKQLIESLKKYLDNSVRVCELFYSNHIDSTIQMIDKVRGRYIQLNEVCRWQRDEVFTKKVTHLTNQSTLLIHMIYDVVHYTKHERIEGLLKHLFFFSCCTLQLRYLSNFKGEHNRRIEAISMCVDQLELTRNSIHQISLHKLAPSISIYSTIHYVKNQINDKHLKSNDFALLSSKFMMLEEWMLSLSTTTHVDIKSHYEDIKLLLRSGQCNLENSDFKWDELTMTVDTLELFLVKLKEEVMMSVANTLKSTLFQFNSLISATKKPPAQGQIVSFDNFRELFSKLNNNANIMSVLAADENQARELLFSAEKVSFVSKQIYFVVEHWLSLNCAKGIDLYHCMMSYLGSLWRQVYYKYLADLHRIMDFDEYFALLEDIYFSAAKEAIRSISTGKAELFHSKSVAIATLLDYILCYVRDKMLSDENHSHFQAVFNKICNFRNKFMRKLYRAFVSVHHFMTTNPGVLLPENYLDKFERLCSNIQSELHDFTSLNNIYNLIHRMNDPHEKLTCKVLPNTVKLLVEQIYDSQITSNVVSSKISVNNITCSIEYDPCMCFVVVNEYGNAVIDVKTYHQLGDTEIINFLKSLMPNTLVVASFVNPKNTDIPDQLINYLTLIDCPILAEFQKNPPSPSKNDESVLNSAILVGYVSKHRYIHWYHTRSSVINTIKPSHIYNDNIPTPLAFDKVMKIEIRQHDPSSSSSINLQLPPSNSLNGNAAASILHTSVVINGVEFVEPLNRSSTNLLVEGTNGGVGCGFCYVFENVQNPHYGNLVPLKLTEVEDFVGGLTVGSVCCFVFPCGIGDSMESVAELFDIPVGTIQSYDNFSAIFIKSETENKGDNIRFVKATPTTPIHLVQYIKTTSSKSDSSPFVNDIDSAVSNGNVAGTPPSTQNNIHSLIKKIKKRDGDNLNRLNKEFDRLQSDFFSQLRKSNLISSFDSLSVSGEKNGSAPADDPLLDNSVLVLAKKISFLVSYVVDVTRSEGPLITDQDIINNCREIKRLGECLIELCVKIANQCQKGPTKSEITNLVEELPLFLQQLLVISRVNYGTVYSRYKEQNDHTDATQMASSLITSSSNILKTTINLLKLTHSAKVQYKLNININPTGVSRSNTSKFMSAIKDLQDSLQKPSTI